MIASAVAIGPKESQGTFQIRGRTRHPVSADPGIACLHFTSVLRFLPDWEGTISLGYILFPSLNLDNLHSGPSRIPRALVSIRKSLYIPPIFPQTTVRQIVPYSTDHSCTSEICEGRRIPYISTGLPINLHAVSWWGELVPPTTSDSCISHT